MTTPRQTELYPNQTDADVIQSIAALTHFEIAEDLQAADHLARSPQTSDLPDEVTSILDAPRLREPSSPEPRVSVVDTAPEHIEADPQGQIIRRDLGGVALGHDRVMRTTRAHKEVSGSIGSRRRQAYQRLVDSGAIPEPGDGAIAQAAKKTREIARKVTGTLATSQPDPRDLGSVHKHIKNKY